MRIKLASDLSKVTTLALMLLVVLACNFPGLKPTPDFDATSVVRTVSARQTENTVRDATSAALTSTPGNQTGMPTATGTPLWATASATPERCEDRMRFIDDITVPDGTYMAPGAGFEKVWRLLNAGTCVWTTEYALVFDSGSIMGGDPIIHLAGNVVPGSTVDLAVHLTAPLIEGSYEGNWLLRNDVGVLFGSGINADKNFWVRIRVGSTPTPTNTASPTPSPTSTTGP